MLAALRRDSAVDLSSLFAAGQAGGFWYPRPTSAYQDAYAGAAVTGDGQRVGLVLDESRGLAAGATIQAVGWTSIGFSSTELVADGFTVEKTSVGGNAFIYSAAGVAAVAGRWYEFEIDVPTNTAGAFSCVLSVGQNSRSTQARVTGTGAGIRVMVRATLSGTFSALIYTDQVGVIEVSSVRVREIAGAHLSQSAINAQPLLLGGSLVFDGNDDAMVAYFDNADDLSNSTVVMAVAGVGEVVTDGVAISGTYSLTESVAGLLIREGSLSADELELATAWARNIAGV